MIVGLEPVLVRLGPLTVRWFGLLLILAVLCGIWMTSRQAARDGLQPGLILDLAGSAVLGGLLGARVLYLLENWEYYLTSPGERSTWSWGGLSAWGALAGGWLAVWLAWRGVGVADLLADATAPGLALGEAIGRFGAFLNGDGQGRPTRLPWGTRYSSNDAMTPDFGVAPPGAALPAPGRPGRLWRAVAAARPGPASGRGGSALGRDVRRQSVVIGLVRVEPAFLFGLQLGQMLGLAAMALSAFAMIRLVRASRAARPLAPRQGS